MSESLEQMCARLDAEKVRLRVQVNELTEERDRALCEVEQLRALRRNDERAFDNQEEQVDALLRCLVLLMREGREG